MDIATLSKLGESLLGQNGLLILIVFTMMRMNNHLKHLRGSLHVLRGDEQAALLFRQLIFRKFREQAEFNNHYNHWVTWAQLKALRLKALAQANGVDLEEGMPVESKYVKMSPVDIETEAAAIEADRQMEREKREKEANDPLFKL